MQHRASRKGEGGPLFERLMAAIENRDAKVGIIGQGYVGLPLAMVIAKAGYVVTGFDVDEK